MRAIIPHRNKMKNNEYETVENIDSDLTLMFENAKRYNVPHSSIYKRALKLQQIQMVSPKVFSVINHEAVRFCLDLFLFLSR